MRLYNEDLKLNITILMLNYIILSLHDPENTGTQTLIMIFSRNNLVAVLKCIYSYRAVQKKKGLENLIFTKGSEHLFSIKSVAYGYFCI